MDVKVLKFCLKIIQVLGIVSHIYDPQTHCFIKSKYSCIRSYVINIFAICFGIYTSVFWKNAFKGLPFLTLQDSLIVTILFLVCVIACFVFLYEKYFLDNHLYEYNDIIKCYKNSPFPLKLITKKVLFIGIGITCIPTVLCLTNFCLATKYSLLSRIQLTVTMLGICWMFSSYTPVIIEFEVVNNILRSANQRLAKVLDEINRHGDDKNCFNSIEHLAVVYASLTSVLEKITQNNALSMLLISFDITLNGIWTFYRFALVLAMPDKVHLQGFFITLAFSCVTMILTLLFNFSFIHPTDLINKQINETNVILHNLHVKIVNRKLLNAVRIIDFHHKISFNLLAFL